MKLSNDGVFRRAAVAAFVFGAVGISAPAIAQDAAAAKPEVKKDDKAVELEKVQVTGSRLKSASFTASSPVTVVSGEEFARNGATLVEDLLNLYPALAPSFDNVDNNPSLGYATVDLRGLGAERTLTLVNGRRIPKGTGESADISIVPAAVIKRTDILTGGASAVYGSDAVAGVVNFLLDDKFTGVSLTGGWAAFQHNNDNEFMRDLQARRGFTAPEGDSGFDGITRNLDFAIGGKLGDKGHAMGWATWRENDPIFQAERDYSNCTLNAAGTRCGGSATADPANFYVADGTFAGYVQRASSGTWSAPTPGAPQFLYNFAPINYYQRPDTRFTTGASVNYEINQHAKPYLLAMMVNRNNTQQIAPSGAFFTDLQAVDCDNPRIGTLCSDLGIGADGDVDALYVAKRNVEGGPRINESESNNFSLTAGMGGELVRNWDYDVSLTYNRASTSVTGTNDFLTSRIRDGLLGCPEGSFAGCIPYDVFTDSVTPEAARALQGISQQLTVTSGQIFNAYVSGDLGFAIPSANNENVSLVVGMERRRDTFSYSADSNLASGNFAGSGAESPPIAGQIGVTDFYMEAGIPIIAKLGILDKFDAQLGYRRSDYDRSGPADTYKIGFGANFLDNKYRLRGGYNRAIRAPGVNDIFLPQQIGLWGGSDPCAGATPEYTAEQCARTGVSAAQYGSIASNPAAQYNMIQGGNPNLKPEVADTFTFGGAATPIKGMQVSLDYYDIEIKDALGPIGARNIIDICALTGSPEACANVKRSARGDLFRGSDPTIAGHVVNFRQNLGAERVRGLDFTGSYSHKIGPGRIHANLASTYLIEQTTSPLQTDEQVAFDCAGNISPQCTLSTPKYRQVTTLRYTQGNYAGGLRWRYMSSRDYEDPRAFRAGRPLTTDKIVEREGGINAYHWFDLNGSATVGNVQLTAGINNIFDVEPPLVGAGLALNGNAAGGYDQLGRYLFTNVRVSF